MSTAPTFLFIVLIFLSTYQAGVNSRQANKASMIGWIGVALVLFAGVIMFEFRR